MYSTCLYCSAKLGANDMLERFPLGRRLAFDLAKGRLWVVCPGCRRWNLTATEDRYHAIEDCERLYRGTYVRISTGNIGLARLRGGLELIRVGAPLRPEFAAWRYAGEFFSRRTRAYARAGATIAGAVGVSAGAGNLLGPAALAASGLSIVAFPAIVMSMIGTSVLGQAMATDYLQYERVLGRFSVDGRVIRVRAKHARSIELGFAGGEHARLGLQHDTGWTTLEDTRAMHAATVLLASANRGGGSRRLVTTAVDQIESAGNSARYLASASRRNSWRGLRPVSILSAWRDLAP